MTTPALKKPCVLFVNTKTDARIVTTHFADAAAYRTAGYCQAALKGIKDRQLPMWNDAGIEGFHDVLSGKTDFDQYIKGRNDNSCGASDWMETFKDLAATRKLGDKAFVAAPDKGGVKAIIDEISQMYSPGTSTWYTIPQLPFTDGSDRNKINLAMAKEVGGRRHANALLVLPAIFTHSRQMLGRTAWRKKTDQILKCLDASGANLLWVVASWLQDGQGGEMTNRRMGELVEFHKYLKGVAKGVDIIAGPYWQMNLVLWAKELVTYPAITLSGTSQFFIPGPQKFPGSRRIVLRKLRRRLIADPSIKEWVEQAARTLTAKGLDGSEFSNLARTWQAASDQDKSREDLCKAYSEWINELVPRPPAARALAIFQSMSEAYVLGCQLPDLPDKEKTRSPSVIAQQLMMQCLA